MNKLDLVEAWYQRMWVEEDFSAIDEFINPDLAVRGLGAHPQLTCDELRAFAQQFLALMDVDEVAIEHSMESGDWIQTLITVRGKSRKQDEPLEFGGQVLTRIVGGKIVESFNALDFMQMFVQMGLLPKDAVERCFSGTGLG